MKTYVVTAKNTPPNLARRISEAHAQAVKERQPQASDVKPST